MYHPERVAQWLEADTWEKAKKVYPIYWEVTTSAACNHRCTFCSVDAIGYPPDLLEANMLIERMKEAKALGVKSVMFAGTGEPLVHKRISDITLGAVNAGLDVAFTTNGTLLLKNNGLPKLGLLSATWIKVSLNAGSQETYVKVHKTDAKDWDKVWAGLATLVAMRNTTGSKTTIGVQCVVLPENVYEMRELAELCVDAGVDYLVLKPYSQGTFSITKQYEGTDYAAMRTYLEGVKDYNTPKFKVIYRSNAMQQEITKSHNFDKCNATPNFWTYCTGDGRMFTCSAHLLDDRFCIGNINTQTFQEIWEGEGRRRNWEMMQGFDIKKCRLNCRMSKANVYLESFEKQTHINFI